MFQEESIYNIVPKELIQQPKERMYTSHYPKYIAPTASTFGLKCTSYPGSANHGGEFDLPRGAHPTYGMNKTFGRPDGFNRNDTVSFTKKGHQYINYPRPDRLRSVDIIKKPAIPSLDDKPIMGLRSDKNYITANAVDVILMASKKHIREEKDYLLKKNYGRVPNYLAKIKNEVEMEYQTIRQTQIRQQEAESRKKKELNGDEIVLLKEGLMRKLELLKKDYGDMSHKTIFDTLVTKRKKERLEGEIQMIEKDMDKLNKGLVFIDMTRY